MPENSTGRILTIRYGLSQHRGIVKRRSLPERHVAPESYSRNDRANRGDGIHSKQHRKRRRLRLRGVVQRVDPLSGVLFSDKLGCPSLLSLQPRLLLCLPDPFSEVKMLLHACVWRVQL